VHDQIEDKNDKKGSFHEELQHVFHKFMKYCIKIMSGNSNTKGGREDMSNQQSGITVYMKMMLMGLIIV
jgi:hypothetical protein